MDTASIISDIELYAGSAIFFNPRITSKGISTVQLQKTIKLDIVNAEPTNDKEIRIYPIDNLDQAYDVMDYLTNYKHRNICIESVDKFVKEQNVNLNQPLYLIAMLVPME